MTQIAHQAVETQQSPAGEAPQAVTKQRQRLSLGPVIGGVVAAVVISGAVGFTVGRVTASTPEAEQAVARAPSAPSAASESRLEAVYDDCQIQDTGDSVSLSDGGATIVIDTRSEYGSTAGLICVMRELQTPQSIKAQVERTTAMMGVQDAEQDGLDYSWSYHPDNGMNMVITETD
ncbi:hypothetical protein SAMN05660657_04595 [Geodermatophilus amargosae]|uniref:Uncharacterized protein n=1 Tax=Geodermatophilus amargosae TaxID=1296565 RepID=A0A1I7CKQ0_9ACTN|nr:hypothetical protein [Geodermatophilus amargosae]SFT99996.1 hypothetical protein SAMN05660657_04595 [Geodermatophilus amargosae]